MKSLNLIPRARIERRVRRRCVARWGGILAAYGSALTIGALVVHGPGDESIQRLHGDARRSASAAEEFRAQRAVLMKDVSSKVRLLEASKTVGVHPDWGALLRTITELRGDRVVLAGIDLRRTERAAPNPPASKGGTSSDESGSSKEHKAGLKPQRTAPSDRREVFTFKITGMGGTHSDVMAFVRRLEERSPLRDVTVVDARAVKMGEGELTSFELGCRIEDREEGTP